MLANGIRAKKRTEEFKKRLSEYKKKIGRKPPIQKGNQCWNWKEGVSSLNCQIRTCVKYKKWTLSVFQRDNFTCQFCGARSHIGLGKSVYLEAHHIKTFNQIMEEYQIKTFEEALGNKELWNINNGITLCKKCHKLLHHKGGRAPTQTKIN